MADQVPLFKHSNSNIFTIIPYNIQFIAFVIKVMVCTTICYCFDIWWVTIFNEEGLLADDTKI